MLFNSITFGLFVPIVFLVYWSGWFAAVRKRQIILILAGSVFYGWWDIRFLGLLFLTATIDYLVARAIGRTEDDRKRKRFLLISIFSNLSVLGFFKYFNFFAGSIHDGLALLGFHADFVTLKIVLPVGISFYTFQALSYTVDVYKRKIDAAKDPFTYFSFITFFPQLMAGPIERAGHMLPQFETARTFSPALGAAGLRLMLLGYFKKSIIADNFAPYADHMFDVHAHPGAAAVIAGTIAFALQAYGDFSGYSDIARGCARLFGFDLIYNFRFPYFANTMRDYWHRWHISMSYWFRDYVYIPLGGNRKGFWRGCLNLTITFFLSGLWHGAAWTFVLWGVWHGVFLSTEIIWGKYVRIVFPRVARHVLVICCAWGSYIFLRSPDISSALSRFHSLFHGPWNWNEVGTIASASFISPGFMWGIFALTILLFFVDVILFAGRIEKLIPKNTVVRWSTYFAFITLFLLFGVYLQPPAFIYFQF